MYKVQRWDVYQDSKVNSRLLVIHDNHLPKLLFEVQDLSERVHWERIVSGMKDVMHTYQTLQRHAVFLDHVHAAGTHMHPQRKQQHLTMKAKEVVTRVEVLEYLARKESPCICAMEADCSTAGVAAKL